MSTVLPMPGVEQGEQEPPRNKVVVLPCTTTLDLDPDRILQAAVGNMETVVILGYDKNGQEYFGANISDGGTVIWMMERAKLRLLRTVDGGPEDFDAGSGR